MIAGWTNFLALIKGPSLGPTTQFAFNEKVLEYNNGVNKQFELQYRINAALWSEIAELKTRLDIQSRTEKALLARIEKLEMNDRLGF